MAKRKRLSPAQGLEIDTDPTRLETKAFGVARMVTPGSSPGASPAAASARPPIAQVAGDASATSALQELAQEVKEARDGGRLIQALPLDQVDAGYLVRDRMMADEDELQVLMTSLKTRGQQTPIEVVDLGADRFGLISGWRRLTALKRLYDETGETRFQTVQALIRTPATAEAAYTAMVEENEIRVGLSYYERARIAAKAVEQGVFPHERAALQELFYAASRAKRSKIGSFLKIYLAADDILRFPTALTERLGGALARQLEERPETRAKLQAAFAAKPPHSAEDEAALIEAVLSAPAASVSEQPGSEPVPSPQPQTDPALAAADAGQDRPAITVAMTGGQITLSGDAVSEDLRDRLRRWLADQYQVL
jgi:ParB-like chromosome segregation protein Spo0J